MPTKTITYDKGILPDLPAKKKKHANITLFERIKTMPMKIKKKHFFKIYMYFDLPCL